MEHNGGELGGHGGQWRQEPNTPQQASPPAQEYVRPDNTQAAQSPPFYPVSPVQPGAHASRGPYAGPATQPAAAGHAAPAAHHPRRTRVWPAVMVSSLASAVLASAGTFGILSLQDDAAPAAQAPDTPATPVATLAPTDLESVVDQVRDTVVAISTQQNGGSGSGSGVVISTDGYVLTNHHVISGARAINVTLADGRIFAADVVGTDPTTDLAVVKLANAPSDLEVATMGSSDSLSVGQSIVAVGNPLGLSSTVTTGIVSALDRPVTTVDEGAGELVVTNAIQVDAAINPGNSGGPLFNLNGEVVGITSSIASLAQGSGQTGSIGLGFAIPSNLAERVATELIDTGSAQHSLLGVRMGDDVAQVDGVARSGAAVYEVVGGSGAADAGVRAGDIITSIDGKAVTGAESLTGFVRQYAPGAQVRLGIVRDGEEIELSVVLGASEGD